VAEVTDLMRVAQYAKSDRDAPSDVYNAACRLLDEMEAIRLGAEKLLNLSLDEGRRADQAEATIERVKAVRDGWYSRPHMSDQADELDIALDGPEDLGDGRTPQTQGAVEGQEAGDAQEAAQ
jgi:hypothetical protein